MQIDRPVTHCVIVDDHLMLLDLLAGVVRSIPGVSLAATATDVVDAERIASLDRVDLLIVDRTLPSGEGMDFVRTVLRRHPSVKCIVIAGATTDFVCPPDLMGCVVSVVDKTHACDTLLAEIRKAVGVAGQAAVPGLFVDGIESRLTPRELELFLVLGEGLSNKELGQRFHISTRTVETHRKSISRKLGQSGAALVRAATLYRHKRLDPEPRPFEAAHPTR